MKQYQIYNDDCTKIMNDLISTNIKVDCVICDLPYYQVVKNDWDNVWKSEESYLLWITHVFTLMVQLLKENSNIILFTSRQYNRKICTILDNLGLDEKRIIIWERKRMMNNTRGKSLTSGYEPICYYSKGENSTFNMLKVKPKTDRKEYKNGVLKDGINLSDVWNDIPALPHNSKEKVNHPTQKPLELMKRCVKLFTNENDIVLDFTMGSGSTGVACLGLNRKFIGIELNKDYFKIAEQRLKEVENKLW